MAAAWACISSGVAVGRKPTASMPNLRSTFFRKKSEPPYTGSECSTTSPGCSRASSVVLMAAMPEAKEAASSAPSQRVRRCSRISRLGLLRRE